SEWKARRRSLRIICVEARQHGVVALGAPDFVQFDVLGSDREVGTVVPVSEDSILAERRNIGVVQIVALTHPIANIGRYITPPSAEAALVGGPGGWGTHGRGWEGASGEVSRLRSWGRP